jgi:glycosyltransferase involved in cell wall biosynthesis
MRILVVSHTCANTSHTQQLYADLSSTLNWEIDIVAPSNWRDEYGRLCALERWPRFHGRLIGIPVRRSGSIILHAYRQSFAPLIRKLNPDVIYVHHEAYAVATAQVYWGNRFAGRRPIGFYSAQNILKRYPIPFRWSENWVYRQSDFALPCSSSVEEVLRAKGFAGPSTVLSLPIDTSTYYARNDAAELRAKLVGDCEFLLGYVGRLTREKGLATLIEALARIKNLNWRLAIVGSGSMEPEMRRLAEAKGISDRLNFVGFVPHLQAPPYLSAFDALVLPSETQSNWREQFGRVLLEAMACGTPVIGSDSGEIPILIRSTGGGLIFAERDVDDLAGQLRKMMSHRDSRIAMANAGRLAVQRDYSSAVVMAKLADVICAAAARSNPPQKHGGELVESGMQPSSASLHA